VRARLLALGVTVGFAFACSAEPDPSAPPPIDPKVACQTRATWNGSFDCRDCQSRAAQPGCDCNPSPFNAVCHEQNVVRLNDCAESVVDCVFGCAPGDCACVDACYAGAELCRRRAAAFDGCIVQTCAAVCK
jgi:hypothetical protein